MTLRTTMERLTTSPRVTPDRRRADTRHALATAVSPLAPRQEAAPVPPPRPDGPAPLPAGCAGAGGPAGEGMGVGGAAPRRPVEEVINGAGAGGDGTAALLQAGYGSLPDLLAPSCLEIGRDFLCLDGRYARTFALVQYPRTVVLGWLNRLVAAGEHLDLSLHLVPLDSAAAQAELTARLTQLRSAQLYTGKHGRLDDAATGTALEDCRRVRQALQEGHEGLLSVSLYITVYGASPVDLEARAARVQGLIAALLAQTRPAVWQAQEGLHSTLPAGHDGLRVRRTLPTSSVVTMFPFTAPRLEMQGGVLWGRATETNALVLVNPWSQPNANVAVLGTSGGGKSYTVKLDLLRTLPLGLHALVIDPDAEYVGLAAALQGQVVQLGPGSAHRLNPLALPRPPRRGSDPGPDVAGADGVAGAGASVPPAATSAADGLAAHIGSLLPLLEVLLAGDGARLSPIEKRALEQGLAACYRGAGITADPATHERCPPILSDLATALADQGDPHGLAERLDRYCTGPYAALFNGQSTVDLDNRLVVFSLAALPEETTDPEVRTAVMLLLAAHVLRTARLDRRRRRRLIIDEGYVLARYPAGDRFLANMARRARKYGLGITVISQQLEDFLDTASGRAVLKNSSIRVLALQTPESLAALGQHLQLTDGEQTRLATCDRGDGLLLVGRQRLFVRMEAGPHEHRLCHTDAAAHEGTPDAPLACRPVSTPARAAACIAQGRADRAPVGDQAPAASATGREELSADRHPLQQQVQPTGPQGAADGRAGRASSGGDEAQQDAEAALHGPVCSPGGGATCAGDLALSFAVGTSGVPLTRCAPRGRPSCRGRARGQVPSLLVATNGREAWTPLPSTAEPGTKGPLP